MPPRVTYSATLDMQRKTMLVVSGLLHAERRRRVTRKGRRSLGCFTRAVLVICWFLDGTRIRRELALGQGDHAGLATHQRSPRTTPDQHEPVPASTKGEPGARGPPGHPARQPGYSRIHEPTTQAFPNARQASTASRTHP
jgi:hypothetical protein